MHALKKLLTLSLSMLLLGQSAVYASPQAEQKQAASLAQYQQQARQAVEQAPWIKTNSKWLFALGGVALGSAVTAIVAQARMNTLKKIQTQEMADFLGKEAASYMADAKYFAFSKASSKRFWTNPWGKNKALSPAMLEQTGEDILKYMGLFDRSVPYADRMVLRTRLAQEPWLTRMPQGQRQTFLAMIDDMSLSAQIPGREIISPRLANLAKTNLKETPALLRRMNVLFSKLSKPGNIAMVTLLLALGVSANDAKAQTVADRINRNFDLFLNATPEELEKMQQSQEIRNVCIEGTKVLQTMSQMDEQQVRIMQGLQQAPASNEAAPQDLIQALAR